ncbi:hypothetical protein BTJ49_01990 [Oleiagrimonas sp. MCCC 1A03011]|nr:hypothetical protein BTJ49_01990 [Oleiagrimonas sp. MCCC 1A03011]
MTQAHLHTAEECLFGWPSASPSTASRHGTFEVIGVPSDFGNSYVSGARKGPEAIRRSSLEVSAPDANGYDHGDVSVFDGSDWMDIVERSRRAIADIVAAGAFPLVLGGDHAVSYAAVSAMYGHGPVDIVWFDAHTDFCPLTDASWHNHKQVLRRIAGLGHVRRMLVIGHRGITYFDESRQDASLDVLPNCADHADTVIPDAWLKGSLPLYVSIDIDVLDPCVAPGTGHPVPGGLDVSTLCEHIRQLARHRKLLGADIMEVNPILDIQGKTSLAAAHILSTLVRAVSGARAVAQPSLEIHGEAGA